MHSRIALHSWLCLLGFAFSAVAATALPTIGQQPTSISVVSGQPATFTVVATGTGTVSYQWRRLGQPIGGEIGNTLTLPAAKLADASFYDVEVKDAQGSTLSQAAQLFVAAPSAAPFYRVDPTFAPCFAQTGSSNVATVAIANDRALVIGGSFSVFMGRPRANLARVSASMVLDASFHPDVDGPVGAIAFQSDGKVLIGGEFTKVDGVVRKGLARLHADGSLDQSFDIGSAYHSTKVRAMVVEPTGTILVAGDFGRSASAIDCRLLRLTALGGRVAGFSFAPLEESSLQAIAVATGGKIVVAFGDKLIRLNSDGSVDPTFSRVSLYSPTDDGRSLVVQSDGKVIVGGGFAAVLARYNADGTSDSTFSYHDRGGSLNSILPQSDGKILIGGSLGYTSTWKSLVRLNADGSVDPTFVPPSSTDAAISGLVPHPDGGFVACGPFLHLGGVDVAGVVRLSAQGAELGRVSGYHGMDGTVGDVIPLPGKRWLVSGWFTHIGTTARARLAILNGDGTVDPSFDPGLGPCWHTDTEPAAVGIAARDGRGLFLVVGGVVSRYNGQDCARIMWINPQGALESSFNGPDHYFQGLKLGPQGQLYVATNVMLSRLSPDGVVEPGFLHSGGVDLYSVLNDGRLVVGRSDDGDLWHYSISRLQADGSNDPSFDSGAGASGGFISTVVPQLDGTTLVGGAFSAYSSGEMVSGLVSLSPTGEVERRLHALQSGLEYVNEVIAVADGSLLLRGNAGASRLALRNYPCLYRLDSDWVVHPLDVYDVTSVDQQRIAVFPTDDGRLLLSNVTGHRGALRLSGLVMIRPEAVSPAPAIQSQPQSAVAREGTTGTFAVTAVGEGTLTYQWLKDGSVIPNVFGDRLTLTAVQPADSGTYTVVVSNDFGKATSTSATLVVHREEQVAYADWAAVHFTADELGDPAISGPMADPDRCGFENLLRYGFKLPARGPVDRPPLQPTTAILYGSSEYFAVRFDRKTYAPDLRYVLEGTDDLTGVWSEVREYLPGYPQTVVAPDIVPMGYAVRRFLRVRVEQVP